MNIFAEIGLFLGGGAIGAAITFIFTKRHYDQVIEKEILGVEDMLKNTKKSQREKDPVSASFEKVASSAKQVSSAMKDIAAQSDAKVYYDDNELEQCTATNYSSMYSKGSNRFVILDTESFDNLRDAIPRYMNYFISDSILAYSDTDDVVKAEDIIGPAAVKELTADKDILHVYDKELNIRYEIYIIKAAYEPVMEPYLEERVDDE